MEQEAVPDDTSHAQVLDAPLPSRSSLMMHIAQLRLMLEVSRNLNSTRELDTLLDLIIKVASEVTGTEAASIILLDARTRRLHFEASTNADPAQLRAIPVPLDGSIAGWIVRNNQPLLVSDTSKDPRYYAQVAHATQFEIRSILGVPLQVKDRTIGVLEVLNKRGESRFSRRDLETLEALAAQAAIAIENARLYKDLQDQMRALQEAQARLVQSEKLAAIGELVAGVAHELNNPLTSIIGYAHLLKQAPLDDQSRRDLDVVLIQAQRAAGIVHGLLDFARQCPPGQKPVQVNSVVQGALELLTHEFRTHHVELTTNLCPELPFTMADPYQLQQVFVNLVNNAFQAMSQAHGRGHLAVTTETGPSSFIGHEASVEPAIRVIFQDDGPGIPPHLLSSIFDPFFTTKPEGQGPGLGLAVCHGIVSEHSGHIWAESEPGRGATLFVELPIVTPEVPRQAADRQPSGRPRRAGQDLSTHKHGDRIPAIDMAPPTDSAIDSSRPACYTTANNYDGDK